MHTMKELSNAVAIVKPFQRACCGIGFHVSFPSLCSVTQSRHLFSPFRSYLALTHEKKRWVLRRCGRARRRRGHKETNTSIDYWFDNSTLASQQRAPRFDSRLEWRWMAVFFNPCPVHPAVNGAKCDSLYLIELNIHKLH